MTIEEIKILGFKRNVDSSDTSSIFTYYTYEVCNGLTFITNPSDKVPTKDDWYVEFFDTEIPIRYYNFIELRDLLANLEKHKVK